MPDEPEVNEASACVTAYWALRTAFCAACCALVPPVAGAMPFSNEFPSKPLVAAVPGKLNSEVISVLEELDDVPDINESIV